MVIEGFDENEDIENSTLLVFNRWGQLVFETKNYQNNWAGLFQNNPSKPLPEGIYYYFMYRGLGETDVGSRSIIR